jgi:hypothetical protein
MVNTLFLRELAKEVDVMKEMAMAAHGSRWESIGKAV